MTVPTKNAPPPRLDSSRPQKIITNSKTVVISRQFSEPCRRCMRGCEKQWGGRIMKRMESFRDRIFWKNDYACGRSRRANEGVSGNKRCPGWVKNEQQRNVGRQAISEGRKGKGHVSIHEPLSMLKGRPWDSKIDSPNKWLGYALHIPAAVDLSVFFSTAPPPTTPF